MMVVQGVKGNTFQWPDFLVMFSVLLISAGIGIYSAFLGKKQKTVSEYLLADRKLRWLPVGLSILVTFQSAVLYLGVPAEIYVHGTPYLLFHIGMGLSVVIVVTVFVPLLYPLKLTSTFEYLDRRFKSKLARTIGSVLGSMNMLLYMGVVIFACAAALNAVSGFPMWAGILLITSVGTFYTTLGGIRGVIWTDVFQFFIMMSGLLAILIQGFITQGGFLSVWRSNQKGGRVEFPSFDPDPRVRHTVWSLVIGGTITWLSQIGINQSNVQRFSSVPNLRAAKLSALISVPGFALLGVLACFVGMIVFAYFHDIQCDPMATHMVSTSNQLVPLYVVEVFDFLPGFPGLFMAAVLSAALSSVSSSINGLTAIIWEDILKWKFKDVSDVCASHILKVAAGCYGVLGMLVAFMASTVGGPASQIALAFFGASGGPLLGMFLLGCVFPCANWIGASFGGIMGFAVCIWIVIGSKSLPPPSRLPLGSISGCYNLTEEMYFTSNISQALSPDDQFYTDKDFVGLQGLYRISYLWYSAIGVCVVIVIGLIVSLLSGRSKYDDIPEDLILPCIKKIHRHRNSDQDVKAVFHSNSAASGVMLLSTNQNLSST